MAVFKQMEEAINHIGQIITEKIDNMENRMMIGFTQTIHAVENMTSDLMEIRHDIVSQVAEQAELMNECSNRENTLSQLQIDEFRGMREWHLLKRQACFHARAG